MKASTRVRDYDSRSRQVERTGPTKTAAINTLKAAIAERDPLPDFVDTAPTTTVTELAEAWLTSL